MIAVAREILSVSMDISPVAMVRSVRPIRAWL